MTTKTFRYRVDKTRRSAEGVHPGKYHVGVMRISEQQMDPPVDGIFPFFMVPEVTGPTNNPNSLDGTKPGT